MFLIVYHSVPELTHAFQIITQTTVKGDLINDVAKHINYIIFLKDSLWTL